MKTPTCSRRLRFAAVILVPALLVSCTERTAPSDPAPPTSLGLVSPAAARTPIDVPIFAQFDDVNPCTGEPITLTYNGTGQLQEFGDHSVLHVIGSVVTTDGYTGSFNWTIVFQGDRVAHVRAHDMEVNDATGQRVIFAVGVEHTTSVDGEPVVSFVHFSKDRIRCIGRR